MYHARDLSSEKLLASFSRRFFLLLALTVSFMTSKYSCPIVDKYFLSNK